MSHTKRRNENQFFSSAVFDFSLVSDFSGSFSSSPLSLWWLLCNRVGKSLLCENLLFSHARWSQIKLRFASFRAWVWVSVTISAFVGLYTGIFCCCWCLGLIMNSWQMVGLLSSFLQHRIFIRFRQGIDFCWHFKSVRRKKKLFSVFHSRKERKKSSRWTQNFSNRAATTEMETKAGGKLKALDLSFILHWALVNHSLGLLRILWCWKLFSLSFCWLVCGWAPNENDVRHVVWIKNDWTEVNWELGRLEKKILPANVEGSRSACARRARRWKKQHKRARTYDCAV